MPFVNLFSHALPFAAVTADIPDKLLYTVVGLAIAFLAAGLILAIVSLYKLISYDIPNSKKLSSGGNNADKPAFAEPAFAAPGMRSAAPGAETGDGALAAVISAAVAVCLEAEANAAGLPAPSFRVVSFRKTGK